MDGQILFRQFQISGFAKVCELGYHNCVVRQYEHVLHICNGLVIGQLSVILVEFLAMSRRYDVDRFLTYSDGFWTFLDLSNQHIF